MSFNVSQVVNGASQPIPVKGLGYSQVIETFSGAIDRGVESTIVDIKSPIVIDSLVFSANTDQYIQVRISGYAGTALKALSDTSANGSGLLGFFPKNIVEQGSAFFDVLAYDNVNQRYKIKLKQPLTFAEGAKITIRNIASGTAFNGNVVVMGRAYE
ncbi:hypothetical protein AAF695_02780 [Aerococcus viridans]